MSKIRWAVIVADPTDAARRHYLEEHGGVPMCIWTIDGKEYWEVSRHECVLDAVSEIKIMRELGWGLARTEPVA